MALEVPSGLLCDEAIDGWLGFFSLLVAISVGVSCILRNLNTLEKKIKFILLSRDVFKKKKKSKGCSYQDFKSWPIESKEGTATGSSWKRYLQQENWRCVPLQVVHVSLWVRYAICPVQNVFCKRVRVPVGHTQQEANATSPIPESYSLHQDWGRIWRKGAVQIHKRQLDFFRT